MKSLITNELRLFFSKKNIGLYIMACILMITLFYFYFVPNHNNYLETQIQYYEQMMNSDSTRSQLISSEIEKLKEIGEDITNLEKSRDFWQTDLENCRLVTYNLLNGNKKNIAGALVKRDKYLQSIIDEGGDLSSYSIMLRNDEKDLYNRIQLQDIYMKNHFYDYVYEKMPTGYYLVSNLFSMGGFSIVIILAFVLLSNYDSWSKEFESSSYKLLFTMTNSRKKMYLVRAGITTVSTTALSLSLIVLLFCLGFFTYGLGNEVLVSIQNQIIPIGMWCFNKLAVLVVLLISLSTMIQVFSLITKNSGISLLIPCLVLLVILTNVQLFEAIFSLNLTAVLIIVLFVILTHYCMLRYLEKIDLVGND